MSGLDALRIHPDSKFKAQRELFYGLNGFGFSCKRNMSPRRRSMPKISLAIDDWRELVGAVSCDCSVAWTIVSVLRTWPASAIGEATCIDPCGIRTWLNPSAVTSYPLGCFLA